MIDFKNVEKYRENNRIEAKRAGGGLPYSVWETYSSFANTMGGVILLGVEEGKDKSFHAIDLKSPEAMVEKLWRQLNDPRRVNVNILTKKNISIRRYEGKRIVVVEVPRANRLDKPVYIENDVWHGTYRRGGEGDYRCTPEEIRRMQEDAAAKGQDTVPVACCTVDAFCERTVARYSRELAALRPGHLLSALGGVPLLERLDAATVDDKGFLRPTAAGLLMFGKYEEIKKAFPLYRLRLSVQKTKDTTAVVKDFEGNLLSFYDEALSLLQAAFPRGGVAAAVVAEAIVNCLVNADYSERGGILVEWTPDAMRFLNPGAFRIDPTRARTGGVSDSRNKAISYMFVQIGIGAGIGGGIPRMIAGWRQSSRPTPYFTESFDPERTCLTLPFSKKAGYVSKTGTQKRGLPSAAAKQLLAEQLTNCIHARAAQLASAVGLPLRRVRRYLEEMRGEELVIVTGQGKNAIWRLKERAGQPREYE